MITTDLLKQFKDSLDITNQQVTALLQQRQQKKLFKNADDYELALKACKYYPSEYYKVRLFDDQITLMFDSRKKLYYINLETQNIDFIRKIEFIEFISDNKLIYKPNLTHFNVEEFKVYYPEEYDFKFIIKLFMEFCNLYLKLQINSDKLFIYNI